MNSNGFSFIPTIFRALRFRNFRLFFFGQGISLVGTWMQQIAMSWLVYRLTNSPVILGVVGFSSQIPTFLLTPLAGVWVDRLDRRRILILTQSLSMIQAFILAFLTLSGTIAVWHIIILSLGIGCINALDVPSRQSFLIDMVEKKEFLGNAIALNSLMFNLARLIGPSIAGVLIALVGEGLCFLLNGISFLTVIISLLMMNSISKKRSKEKAPIFEGLREGFRYAFGFEPIRAILFLISVISMMGMSQVVLMPVFAKDVLKGGPRMLGFLMTCIGAGALIVTVLLASRKNLLRLGSIIPVSASIFAMGLFAFSLSRITWLSGLFLAITGFGFMAHMASSNTVLQTIVEDDKRGRVMSFYTMAFMGMAPLGSLWAGWLASDIGATQTLLIGSSFCVLASLIFAHRIPTLKRLVKPIYEKMESHEPNLPTINSVT